MGVGVGGGWGGGLWTAAGVKKKASSAVYIQYSTVSVLLTVLVLLPKPNLRCSRDEPSSEAIVLSCLSSSTLSLSLWIFCCFAVLLLVLLSSLSAYPGEGEIQ